MSSGTRVSEKSINKDKFTNVKLNKNISAVDNIIG